MSYLYTQVVTLDFTFFSTESCCDFVELHDGDSVKSPAIVKLSGFLSPPPGGFNSTQRNMFIRFTTDSTITDRGFSAVYSSEAPGLIKIYHFIIQRSILTGSTMCNYNDILENVKY